MHLRDRRTEDKSDMNTHEKVKNMIRNNYSLLFACIVSLPHLLEARFSHVRSEQYNDQVQRVRIGE